MALALETVKDRWGRQPATKVAVKGAGEGATAVAAQPEAEEEEEEEVEGAALLCAARNAWSASGETEAAAQQVRTRLQHNLPVLASSGVDHNQPRVCKKTLVGLLLAVSDLE